MTTTSRIFIETMIRRAIHELEDAPKRTLRNLVDMALHFSHVGFQRHFFQDAQSLLENEASAYYDLFHDIVTHVEEDRLVSFGMNVGYNSCTLGAKTIREIESNEHFNIPWTMILHVEPKKYSEHPDSYHSIIREGKTLGIFTWQFHLETQPEQLFPLIARHPDCAFIVFCQPSDITPALIEEALELKNLMFALQYEENMDSICQNLRKNRLLYAVSYTYSEQDKETILNDDLFYSIQQLHPLCIALRPDPYCSAQTQKLVYQYIQDLRLRQCIQAIPIEQLCDCRLVDSIISHDSCIAEFEPSGNLVLSDHSVQFHLNLFHVSLKQIFQSAFPKTL